MKLNFFNIIYFKRPVYIVATVFDAILKVYKYLMQNVILRSDPVIRDVKWMNIIIVFEFASTLMHRVIFKTSSLHTRQYFVIILRRLISAFGLVLKTRHWLHALNHVFLHYNISLFKTYNSKYWDKILLLEFTILKNEITSFIFFKMNLLGTNIFVRPGKYAW